MSGVLNNDCGPNHCTTIVSPADGIVMRKPRMCGALEDAQSPDKPWLVLRSASYLRLPFLGSFPRDEGLRSGRTSVCRPPWVSEPTVCVSLGIDAYSPLDIVAGPRFGYSDRHRAYPSLPGFLGFGGQALVGGGRGTSNGPNHVLYQDRNPNRAFALNHRPVGIPTPPVSAQSVYQNTPFPPSRYTDDVFTAELVYRRIQFLPPSRYTTTRPFSTHRRRRCSVDHVLPCRLLARSRGRLPA